MGRIQDVQILYERESGVYKAQEEVKGSVVIKVADDVKVESKYSVHIYLRVHVDVYMYTLCYRGVYVCRGFSDRAGKGTRSLDVDKKSGEAQKSESQTEGRKVLRVRRITAGGR